MSRIQQTAFWIFAFVGLVLTSAVKSSEPVRSFYFVCLLFPVIMGTSFWFNHVLVPRFLLQEKYWSFSLYLLYTLVISVYLEFVVITVSFVVLAEYNYEQLNPMATDVFGLTVTLYLIVILNTVINLIRRLNAATTKQAGGGQTSGSLLVRANRKLHQIPYQNITYIESLGDYVRIKVESGDPIVSKTRISQIVSMLPKNFLRTHRSFVVNRNRITTFNKTVVNIGSHEIPISRGYRKIVSTALTKS